MLNNLLSSIVPIIDAEPKKFISFSTSLRLVCIKEFITTLSAPESISFFASSTDLMPPPAPIGTSLLFLIPSVN